MLTRHTPSSNITSLMLHQQLVCVFVTSCREEVGDVYAIDIGGTNFRVMYVHLADGKSQVVSAGWLCSAYVVARTWLQAPLKGGCAVHNVHVVASTPLGGLPNLPLKTCLFLSSSFLLSIFSKLSLAETHCTCLPGSSHHTGTSRSHKHDTDPAPPRSQSHTSGSAADTPGSHSQ